MSLKEAFSGECCLVIFQADEWFINTSEFGVNLLLQENQVCWNEQIMAEQITEARNRDSRSPQTSLIMVDAPSVKNGDTAAETGYDAGNKVS